MCVFNVNKPALSLSAKAGQVVLLVVAWFVSLLLPGCVFSPPRLDYSKYTAEQLNDFGVVYEESGNLAEAQRAYSKALEKDPSNHVAASNLGNIYCRKGEYEEAFVHYRKALAIRPDYVPALNNLANAQIETEDYAGAAENLQKAGDEKEWEKWTEMAEAIKPVTVISDVPFFRQKQHECGPAALACVYNFLGLQQDVEEISKRIYSRKQKGSLNLQLLIDAREQGLTATMYSGSFERIREAVDDGTPLTLMISEGGDSLHYIVVVGYEGDGLSTIVVHDGYRPHKRYAREELETKWRATGYCTIEIR
jgi:tetratricopeptide (TPR) repeat protein